MLNAREVAFPSKPAVSAEAKDFIRRWGLSMVGDRSSCVCCAQRHAGQVPRGLARRAWLGTHCQGPGGQHCSAPPAPVPHISPAPPQPPPPPPLVACDPPSQLPGVPAGGPHGCACSGSPPLYVLQEAGQGCGSGQGCCSSVGVGGGGQQQLGRLQLRPGVLESGRARARTQTINPSRQPLPMRGPVLHCCTSTSAPGPPCILGSSGGAFDCTL